LVVELVYQLAYLLDCLMVVRLEDLLVLVLVDELVSELVHPLVWVLVDTLEGLLVPELGHLLVCVLAWAKAIWLVLALVNSSVLLLDCVMVVWLEGLLV
jgi:hypothetical protein